jgi:hypothetical protein
MFEKITLPNVTDDDNRTLNRLLEQLDAKEPRNLLRSSYYDGKRVARQVSSIVPPMYHRLAMVLGWSGKAVDALARRCTLDGFTWSDGDLGDLGASDVYDNNHLTAEINSAVVSSLLHGVAFLVNTRGEDDEPESLIHVRDARHATGTWNHRRRSLDDLVSVQEWDDLGRPTALALYLDGLTITAEKDAGVWEVERSEHDWGVPAEALVYKYRHGRPFGSSRISRPVMSIHDMALRELPRLEGHMDVYSFPEFWMLGADESIFKNEDGTTKATWQVVVGRIKGIPDDEDAVNPRADVKQFPASSPEPHLAALNGFAKLFARETSLPDSALAITDVSNPTSAESYDASQYELIAEAEGATDDFSRPLRRSMIRALAIQNGETSIPDSWKSIDSKWRDPRYLSRAAQADAGMKTLTAAPELAGTEVGYQLLGLTEQQIKVVMADQRRKAGSSVVDRLLNAPTDGQREAADIKAKADAMGILIRAGASPESAAAQVGLAGLEFTGAVPVSLRMPESQAARLEQQ